MKYNSKEEAIKHLHHAKDTISVDMDEPLKAYKDDYLFKLTYLGEIIYMINTKPLDKKLEDFIKDSNSKKIKKLVLNQSDMWTGKTDTDLIVNKINELIDVINEKDEDNG